MMLGVLATSALLLVGCSDDDSFSTSPDHLLSFSMDTVRMDTVFSTVPSSTRSLWAYNRSGDGIRCSQVRLERGNQSGFRVNVNGTYLGQDNGYQTSGLEIRKKDSIRIFVEVTAPRSGQVDPQPVRDNIVFSLESGKEQKINLLAYTWDAQKIDGWQVSRDTTLQSSRPVVVYQGITVAEGATLTIGAGTTLYFHSGAGMDVYGKLVCKGSAGSNVVLRGDRLDRMFDYLPYDRVSGQWNGIHIHAGSVGNQLSYTDLHGAFTGITVDSMDTRASVPALLMEASTVHNCQGYGLASRHSVVILKNCVFSNTLNDCVWINGGQATLDNCTLAQFYPFDAERGAAIRFSNQSSPLLLSCKNSLITGYADDELMGEKGADSLSWDYTFDHCVIRTPAITSEDSIHFPHVVYENVKDTINGGKKQFLLVDENNLVYDFHLKGNSVAISSADASTALPTDRDGLRRDDKPDIGAYEYKEK